MVDLSIVTLVYQRDEPPWIRAIGKTPGETLGFSMGIPLTWPSFGCWRPRHRQDHVSQGSGLVHWDTWNFRQNHGDFCHQAIGDLYEMDDHNPYSMSWPWHNGICPWKHCHSLSNTSFLQLAHACAGAASHSPLVKVMKLKPFERWNMSFLSHLLAASMTPDFPLNTHPSADETHSICPNFDFDLITKSPQMMSWWGRSQHDVMIGRILIGSHCRFISSLEGTWIYMTFCDFPLINLSFGKSPGFLGGQKWGSRSCRCFGSELQEHHLLQLQLGHADLQMARGIGEIAPGPLSDCLLVALKGWGCGSALCPWLAMWIFDDFR